jgi:CAMSAP CH domain
MECFIEIFLQSRVHPQSILAVSQQLCAQIGLDIPQTEPLDLEDALLTWLDIVVSAVNETGPRSSAEATEEAFLTDLWTGLSPGLPIAKLIMHFEPELVSSETFFVEDNLTTREKIFNWQRVLRICRENLGVFASFPAETIAHARPEELMFRSNLLAFLIDLYQVFHDESRQGEDMFDEEEDEAEQEQAPQQHLPAPAVDSLLSSVEIE